MSIYITAEYFRQWREEYAKRKEPVDSNIEKRRKTVGDPPKDKLPNPDKGGPSSSANPDNSTAPSPDQSNHKKALDDMPWFMGCALEAELDPQTGLAKWPLSFKRVQKDVKLPNKPVNPSQDTPKNAKNEQPPTAC